MDLIALKHGTVAATVCPVRGALLATLTVGNTSVLYMDEATLHDVTKSVRGGVPLLFPFAGRLENDRLLPANTVMKQHGFGRNRAWAVAEKTDGQLRLTLSSDDETRAVYPYDFAAEHLVTLLPRGVQLDLLIGNSGRVPMPVSPGWHPYFTCNAAEKPNVVTDVTNLSPARFTGDAEFDFGVTAPADGRAIFTVPGLGKLRLSSSPDMRFLQCWSLPQKPFICLEPFMGPPNTVNTERKALIQPGEYRTFWMRAELV